MRNHSPDTFLSFLPSRFPSPLRQLPSSPCAFPPLAPPNHSFLPSYRSVFRVYLSSSRPSLVLFSLAFALKRDSIHSLSFLSSNRFWMILAAGLARRKGPIKRFPPNCPRGSGYFKQLLSAVPATTKPRLHATRLNTHDSPTVYTRLPGQITRYPLASSLSGSLAAPVCLLFVVYRAFWQVPRRVSPRNHFAADISTGAIRRAYPKSTRNLLPVVFDPSFPPAPLFFPRKVYDSVIGVLSEFRDVCSSSEWSLAKIREYLLAPALSRVWGPRNGIYVIDQVLNLVKWAQNVGKNCAFILSL